MERNGIYLLPLGAQDSALLESIRQAIERTFGLVTTVLPPSPIPQYALDPSRGQYLSTAILRRMMNYLPNDSLRMLGVTDVDLFVPQLNSVFGEAAVDGQVSVISLHRLHPGFYGQPSDDRLFTERAVKEAIHEIGHTFGLKHCDNPHCIMHFSNNIADTDRKSAEFCWECARTLQSRLHALGNAA